MSTKYIKFGLRADKSLDDLSSASISLANLLDDLSEEPFQPADLLIIEGIRNTDIRQQDFTELDGGVQTYTSIAENALLEVIPRITIQDNINNFRSVVGNPPYLGGGDGPIAYFVPSNRINPNTEKKTMNANSNTATSRQDLSATDVLFTTYEPAVDEFSSLSPIVGPEFFWDRGIFEFGSKLHPSFPNQYGLIQWTGYLTRQFVFSFETTGLVIIEEDPLDDGNWVKIKSIYHPRRSLTVVSFTDDGTNTTIDYGNDIIHAAINDVVTVPGDTTEYIVLSVNNVTKQCVLEGVPPTLANGQTLTHTHVIGQDTIELGTMYVTEPRIEFRTKVRFTLWFPPPTDLPSELGYDNTTLYREKTFIENRGATDRLPFTDLYSTFDKNQDYGEYSYKVFEDNRAKPLNQSMDVELASTGTIRGNYVPPYQFSEILLDTFSVTHEGFGRLRAPSTASDSIEVGDWMVSEIGGTLYAFQIEAYLVDRTVETLDKIIYISEERVAAASIGTPSAPFTVQVFKNIGLIGLYQLNGSTNTLTLLDGAQPITEVYQDYLLFSVQRSGAGSQNALRISSIEVNPAQTTNIITTEDVFGNSAIVPATTDLIGLVYSHTGLRDLSTIALCEGVYGKEVDVTSLNGASTIVLTDVSGITAGASGVGDYIQFDGVIPDNTYVTAVDTNTNTITISNALVADLDAASTVVFIDKDFHSTGNPINKEFCVIPLNTAPPFEGTDNGLSTTNSYPNFTANKLAFRDLEIYNVTVQDLTTNPAAGGTDATGYVNLEYDDGTTITNYKMLVG